jgi:TolB protein
MRWALRPLARRVCGRLHPCGGSDSRGGLDVEDRGFAYPGNGKIYLINANGTGQRVLVSGSAFKVDHWGGMAWSRDGSKIAFAVGRHREGGRWGTTLRLYVANGDGTDARPLRGAPVGSFDPTWSPDGSQIAFSIRGNEETRIAVVGVDGTGFRTIARADRGLYWVPDWSPDGSWILFEARPDSRLMAIRPDGTGLHQVASIETGNHCICADWSSDGKRIAYQAPGRDTPERFDYPELWVMNADGSAKLQLTRNGARDENPDWSPDDKRIAFYSERTGNAEIFWIPAAGGQARRVTNDPWYNGAPRWQPTG